MLYAAPDPLARCQMTLATGRRELTARHHQYWPGEAAMAEGDPTLLLERGERASLPPALVIQGREDANLTPDMGERFTAAYRRAGGHAGLAGYDDAPHGFITNEPDGPAARAAAQRLLAFARQFAAGPGLRGRRHVRRLLGDGVFPHAHGVHVPPDDLLFLTDDGDHTVRKCTPGGTVLLELGPPGRPSGFMSCQPFNRCTRTALAPDADIWVSDGYQNAVVHRYSPGGALRRTFGRPGVGPGEFSLPHALAVDADGLLYVADRENHRIQLFDDDGRYVTEWRDLHRPSTIVPLPGPGRRWLVGEIGPVMRFNRGAPNLSPRLSVLDAKETVLARLGTTPAAGLAPGQFLSPHGIAVDARGDIYIAQVSATAFPQLFPGEPVPSRLPSLQKLIRED